MSGHSVENGLKFYPYNFLKEEAQISTEVESRVSACEIWRDTVTFGTDIFTLNYPSLVECTGGGWDPARQQSRVPLHQQDGEAGDDLPPGVPLILAGVSGKST